MFTLDPDDEVEPATATAQDLREEGEAKTEEPYFGFCGFPLLLYPQLNTNWAYEGVYSIDSVIPALVSQSKAHSIHSFFPLLVLLILMTDFIN